MDLGKILITAAMILLTNTSYAAEVDNELAIIAAEQADSNAESPAAKPEVIEEVVIIQQVDQNTGADKNTDIDKNAGIDKNADVDKNTGADKNADADKNAGIDNIVNYANFEELAQAVKFTPLYIPKKSGYAISQINSVASNIAEIKYGRRWEPEVALQIRTYKRQAGEALKDISGVSGVKWRVDMTSGTSVYIAKIDEHSHVAAWSSGNYTFSAYVLNLSFAAFHSLVIDELVDLTTHYYR